MDARANWVYSAEEPVWLTCYEWGTSRGAVPGRALCP